MAGTVDVVLSGPASGTPIVTPPDLQILVPTPDISVGTNPDTGDRQLQFTHITWDAGTGPFLITPKPNRKTGMSSFTQTIFQSSTPGVWRPKYKVALAAQGVFDAPSDYRYPLTRFTLDRAAPDGSPGPVVATSPKTDYCITADAFVGTVPHTPNHTSPPQGHCSSPHASLGFSVGWGDQYDQTDNGQPIDLTGVPDGTYVLRATVDPQHVFTESDATNDVTDTVLQLSGDSVTVLGQSNPVVEPPSVSLVSPVAGASLSGTVDLQATVAAVAPATVVSVQYMLDGLALGAPITDAPYDFAWNTVISSFGAHSVSAQVIDSNGTIATAPPVSVTVAAGASSGLGLDASLVTTGHNAVSVSGLSTTSAGATLIALVAADGPAGAASQSVVVSGKGATWRRVARADGQSGDAEVWSATATSVLSQTTVSAHVAVSGYDLQLSVFAFHGSGGIGASVATSGPSGAPDAGLTTTAAGSVSFAVGEDWDNAVGRTAGPGQSLVRQWVDTGSGDTFWAQGTVSASTAAGEPVAMDDTAPTADQWNLAAVEVVPAPAGPATPVVALGNPVTGTTVSGPTKLVASVSAAAAGTAVQFLVDDRPLGAPVTTAPYVAPFDTATLPDGTHTVTAVATTATGAQGRAPDVALTTRNPAPPMTCFVLQAQADASGRGVATTRPFHTASAGESLVAFVTGSGAAGRRLSVAGAGLHWHLVRAVTSSAGRAAAVWSATAPGVLSGARVTARGPAGQLRMTVVAMEGVDGVGATAAAAGSTGSPLVRLTTTRSTSLVFALGVSTATMPLRQPGWVSLTSARDRGGVVWVQYTNVPTGSAEAPVTVQDAGTPGSPWAMVAVELRNDGG